MPFEPPEQFNIAEYFLDARVREGNGDRVALLTAGGSLTYSDVQSLANRFGNLLRQAGVEPENRVIIALPDGPEYVAALFGIVKIGAVVVMVNPYLKPDEIDYFYGYTRAKVAIVHHALAAAFADAARRADHAPRLIRVGDDDWDARLAGASDELESFSAHRDDAAIWLFSGGTTGKPKAVVQTHTSFANTTECYGKGVLGLTERDITLSVPKLFFGYATGSNLFWLRCRRPAPTGFVASATRLLGTPTQRSKAGSRRAGWPVKISGQGRRCWHGWVCPWRVGCTSLSYPSWRTSPRPYPV